MIYQFGEDHGVVAVDKKKRTTKKAAEKPVETPEVEAAPVEEPPADTGGVTLNDIKPKRRTRKKATE